jgi:type VI protein secretion system component VasF
MNGREAEDEAILARVTTVRDREERLAAIVADLRKMEEQRRAAEVHPTDAELATYVILCESADAALEGLPTCFGPLE